LLQPSELKYPLVLCGIYHWPLDARTLGQVSWSSIFLGAFPLEKDAHLFDVVGVSASCVPAEEKRWLDWLMSLGLELVMPATIMSLDLPNRGQAEEKDAKVEKGMVEWCYVDPGAV
jgi:hypothetical protein